MKIIPPSDFLYTFESLLTSDHSYSYMYIENVENGIYNVIQIDVKDTSL